MFISNTDVGIRNRLLEHMCGIYFEMWCYRQLLRVRWTDKMRNEEVLETSYEEASLTEKR